MRRERIGQHVFYIGLQERGEGLPQAFLPGEVEAVAGLVEAQLLPGQQREVGHIVGRVEVEGVAQQEPSLLVDDEVAALLPQVQIGFCLVAVAAVQEKIFAQRGQRVKYRRVGKRAAEKGVELVLDAKQEIGVVEGQMILDDLIGVPGETVVVVGPAVFFARFELFGDEGEVGRVDEQVGAGILLQQLRIFVDAVLHVFTQGLAFGGEGGGMILVCVVFERVERGKIDAVVAQVYQQVVSRWVCR